MNQITEAVLTIVTAIIGVAVLALLISPKARTSQVIQAGASAVGNMLAVAQSPVTGEKVNIDTSYPDSGMFGNLNIPMNNY
jgi:hypothetical protein